MAKLNAWITDLQIAFTKLTGWMMPAIDASIRLGRAITALIPLYNLLKSLKTKLYAISLKSVAINIKEAAVKRLVAIRTKLAAAAQWALNVAMNANPVGLLITGLSALAAGLVWLYKKFDWFRIKVQGLTKLLGDWFFGWVDKIFPGMGEKIKRFFGKLKDFVVNKIIAPLKKAVKWVKGLFGSDEDETKELSVSVNKEIKEDKRFSHVSAGQIFKPGVLDGNTVQTKAAGSSSGSGPITKRNINVHIERLVSDIHLHVTNLEEGAEKIREAVREALVGAVRDFEVSIS